VSALLESLQNEVMTLKETIQARDEALSGTGREIEVLRATIHDRDEVLRAAEKAHDELHDQIMGWQTHAEGKFSPNSDLNLNFLCFLLT
jgi:thioesterase domain-containing protein